MNLKIIVLSMLCYLLFTELKAQQTFTLAQQKEDFDVFLGGLKEGHAGLYYFITEKQFRSKCDSIQATFQEKASLDSYYLKLRYLITLLRHGHTTINLPYDRYPNYKMSILDKTKLYLPFQFIILSGKLYVLSDCSKEQSISKGSEITTINGMPSQTLIASMRRYLPADGINTTFKDYNLYNYYYFHFLYNLMYPSQDTFVLTTDRDKAKKIIKARSASEIETTYLALNNKSINKFDNPLRYDATVAANTAYLKIGSFYKGFIESFGNQYISFIDTVFTDLNKRNTKQLILDLRSNEGGGDSYDFILFSHISSKPFSSNAVTVAGRAFPFSKYAVNLSDDVKAYIANPNTFLTDNTGLTLKDEYNGKAFFEPSKDIFKGTIYILINGGSFSAANTFIRNVYNYRNATSQKIIFVGEENGGDIYSNIQCAGQSYNIKLPHSAIIVNMPILAEGTLNTIYPDKRLPDYKVDEKIEDIMEGKDGVLQFVLHQISQEQ